MSAGTLRLGPLAGVLTRPAAIVGSVRVETVVDRTALWRLRGEWSELLEASRSDNVFLTWEWMQTWWKHLSAGRKLAVLTVRRGNELVGIAPFVANGRSFLGVPKLQFLGTGRVGSDYLDVIVRRGEEPEVIASLAHHLQQSGAALDLRQSRLTASLASDLARELRRSGCPIRLARTHRCPVIEFGGRSWETYLAGLGSEHRYDFQRKLRKLEARHDLKFEQVSSEERRRELLPVLFELHRLRWSARGGSDGLVGPEILDFHDDWTGRALERGWLRLFVLWVEGSPAAALYAFRYRDVFSFYQSGFDPRFRKLSVGLVAMGLAIKSAIEEGAAEFDLLHGEEAYKFHWTKKTRRLGRVSVFPSGPRGHLSWGAAAAVDAARSLRRTLRRGAPAGAPAPPSATASAKGGGGGNAAPAR